MLIYIRQKSNIKKSKSKKLLQLQKEHDKYLVSLGIKNIKRSTGHVAFPDLTISTRRVADLSNQIPSNGFKRTNDDYKWRKGKEEKPETIAEAEKKKKRIAPAYNKGPVMYITDDADKVSLGRKI